MKSTNYVNKIHPQLEAAFKSQDPELFDIVFDIEGKKLYADKLSLSNNSSTFESMLSDRWISKNDAIKIEAYKFNDFKELLTFIYSGECNLTDENIYTIFDMAEFYQIEELKKLFPRGFLFTSDELADILKNPNLDARVKITNSFGKLIYCDLSGKQKYETEIIKSLNGRESENKNPLSIYWDTRCKKPSTPSPLKKRDGVQWYLTYFVDGDIGVIRCSELVFGYYLIAEMFAETDFQVTRYCKIEIE